MAGFIFVKTSLKTKISSLYVYPEYRSLGVAHALLETVNSKILGAKHLTMAEEVESSLGPIVESAGYRAVACVLGKYRENKREYVYQYL